MAEEKGYDAFVSYSHIHDDALAPRLQADLERFAKPWYKLRALRVFCDTANLSTNPALWPSIVDALSASRWFILLASAPAAQSEWVNNEVRWWLANRSVDHMLIVATSPGLIWDKQRNDWAPYAPVPPALRGASVSEPRFTDLSGLNAEDRKPRIPPELIAELAAPLHGVPKDQLIGEHLREHRRTMLLTRGAIVLLTILTAAAATLGFTALGERDSAISQAHIALSGQLAALTTQYLDHDAVTAALLSAAAWQEAHTPQAAASMLQVLAQPVRGVLAEGGPFKGAAFSRAHGGVVVTVGRSFVVWSLDTNQPIAPPITLPAGGTANEVAVSPDGTVAATADADGTVRLWDIPTGRQVGPPMRVSGGAVNAVAFDPANADVLATADEDGTARLWDITTRRELGRVMTDGGQVTGSTEPMTDVAFSPSGTLLATSSDDGSARLWKVGTQRQFGHAMTIGNVGIVLSPMLAVAFSPSGTVLAGAEQASGGGLWNVATQARIVRSFASGPSFAGLEGAQDVAFNSTGTLIAVAGADGSAWLWDAATGALEESTAYATEAGGMSQAVFGSGPAGTLLATVSHDGAVRLWDETDYWNFTQLNVGATSTVAFGRGNTIVATAGDGGVRCWDLVTGHYVGAAIPLSRVGGVSALAFSPDGTVLATGNTEGTVQLWNPATGGQVGPTIAVSQTGPVTALAFDPVDSTVLATGDSNGTVRQWDVHTGRLIRTILPAAAGVGATGLAFGPHGTTLAILSSTGTVRVWGAISRRLTGHPFGTGVTAMAFSPDGSLLATADQDGTARLWSPSDGQQVGIAMAASSYNQANWVAFSPNGTFLATAGEDGIARLWDVAIQQEIGVGLRGGSVVAGLTAVAFSQNGSAVATVGSGTAALWRVAFPGNTAELYRAVCTIAGRSLTRAEWNSYIGTAPYLPGCPGHEPGG